MTHSPEYKAGFAAAVEAAAKVAGDDAEMHYENARASDEGSGARKSFVAMGMACEALAQEIRALSPGDGWCRDMDAAPKDGAYILAWVNGAPEIIFWSQHTGNGWTDGNPERGVAPTAWRHLPEPPKEGE